MQPLFHVQQFFTLTLQHLRHRNSGCSRHDFGDFLRADLGAQQFALRLARRAFRLLELRFELRNLAVLKLGNLLPVTLALGDLHFQLQLLQFFLDVLRTLYLSLLGFPDIFKIGIFAPEFVDFLLDQRKAFSRGFILFLLHRFPLDFQLNDSAIELVHLFRLGIDFHLDAGCRFVDQIDCLVRKKAVGDVPMRKLRRSHDCRISDVHAVMQFVLLFQTAQDGNGAFN